MASISINAGSPISTEVRSSRCCGRSPSGPPEDPGLNDLIALFTSSIEHTILSTSQVGGKQISVCAGGCFSSSLFLISSDGGNIVSADEIILIAPDTSPTESFDVTWSFRLGCDFRGLCFTGSPDPLIKESIY